MTALKRGQVEPMKRTLQNISEHTHKGGLHETTHTPPGMNISASDMNKIQSAPTGSTVHGTHGEIHVTTRAKRQVALAHTYEHARHG